MKMSKKGEWAWEEISKIIIILVILIILIFLTYTFKDKLLQVVEKIKDIFNAKR